MVGLDCSVGTIGHLRVAKDVLSGGVFDEFVDGVEYALRTFRRVVDVVVHVVFSEVDTIEGDELCAGFVGATLQFSAKEARLISFCSLFYLAYNGVGDEDGLSFRVVFQDFCQFVALGLCIDFQLVEVASGHILTRHNNDDLGIWQYRGVVVHVVCHVADFGARNHVESGGVGVGGASKDGCGEKEKAVFAFFLLRLLLIVLRPFRALPVFVPRVATATLEGLTPIGEVPILGDFPIVRRPNLLPVDGIFPELDKDLALTVVYVGAAVFSALGRLDDDSSLFL